MPIITVDTSSDADDGATSRPPDASNDGVTSIPPDVSVSVDVTSATNIVNGPVSNRNNDASIDSESGSAVYVITGVVIAIIVLGIVIALVAAVLFMKARYSYTLIMVFD